jgi:universal stress protein E
MTASTFPSTTLTPHERFSARRASIIVASGGSDPTSPLQAAHALAENGSHCVLAVTVLEPPAEYGPTGELILMPPEFEAERVEAMERTLHSRVAESYGSDSVGCRVLYGDPANALADIAKEEGAGLIVMGIGHHRPIDRLLGAETTLRTVRRARCAVLAVPAGVTTRPRQVLIAVDFSDASLAAAREAIPFLAKDATLHLVHCWKPESLRDDRADDMNAEYLRSFPRRMEEFVARMDVPSGMTVHHALREGRAAECVLVFAKAHHIDLIVAGRRGASLLERLMVGSVTKRLLRAATCSLFIANGTSTHV